MLMNRPIVYFDTSTLLITLILFDAAAELRVVMQRFQGSQFPIGHASISFAQVQRTKRLGEDGLSKTKHCISSIHTELSRWDLYWSIGWDEGLIVGAQSGTVLISGTFCFT